MKIARLTNLSRPVSALASLLLVSLWGFLREVSRRLTLREGNLHVHHGACDHLPQSSGPWDLHDRVRRQFKSGATDNGRLSGTTRLRVGQGILGASSALSLLEIQGLGMPVRQSRAARPRQGLVTDQIAGLRRKSTGHEKTKANCNSRRRRPLPALRRADANTRTRWHR